MSYTNIIIRKSTIAVFIFITQKVYYFFCIICLLKYVTISPFRMGSPELVFEVHYGGRFDRHFRCEYVSGSAIVHHETFDHDKLSFFEIEGILKEYGYKSGDLMYFKYPGKSLVDGLHLITSDDDVLFSSSCHIGHNIIHLYIVSFGEGRGDEGDNEEDDYKDENEYRARVGLHDPWWEGRLSDNEDLFDVDVDGGDGWPRPSTQASGGGGGGGVGPSTQYSFEGEVDDNTDEGDDDDNTETVQMDYDVNNVGMSEGGDSVMSSFEIADDEDINFDMGRSDILESPCSKGEDEEDEEVTHAPNHDFHVVDLDDPDIKLKQKFPDIKMFREAVKMYNVRRGKDIRFKRNERRKCIVVCRDPNCHYRVYGRQMVDEQSFQVISMQPKHMCGRKYKNYIVNATWIADKLVDKFKVQPNMPLDVILDEVKDRWKVDVSASCMYRARRLENKFMAD